MHYIALRDNHNVIDAALQLQLALSPGVTAGWQTSCLLGFMYVLLLTTLLKESGNMDVQYQRVNQTVGNCSTHPGEFLF